MQTQPAPQQDQISPAVTPDRPPRDVPAASPVDAPSPHLDESDQPGELNPRQLRLLSALGYSFLGGDLGAGVSTVSFTPQEVPSFARRTMPVPLGLHVFWRPRTTSDLK